VTGNQVSALRQKLGLSQVQLAQLLGVHPLTVSKWERDVLAPTDHHVQLLASFAKARRAKAAIGSEVAALLVTAGVVVALFTLLEAAIGNPRE
jgi:transcriptional regulator with XRE-family HTH domain